MAQFWACCCSICTVEDISVISAATSVRRWLSGVRQCFSWGVNNNCQIPHCINDITHWLSASRLHLNPAKTVLIWLDSRQQLRKIGGHKVPIISLSITPVDTARDLSIILDNHLTMSAHVSSVCRSAYCFLRQLCPLVWLLSVDSSQDGGSSVHLIVLGLLQLCSIWHLQRLTLVVKGCYKTLRHAWSLAPEVVNALLWSCSSYAGDQCDSEWNLRSLSWSKRHSTIGITVYCQTIASSLRPLAVFCSDNNYQTFQVHYYQHKFTSWWSCIRCCQAMTLERSTHTHLSAGVDNGQFLLESKNVFNTQYISIEWLLFLAATFKFPYLLTIATSSE